MITIKLVDARKGLHSKCVELFKDLKIAESIYWYLCDGIEECENAEPERKKGKWIQRSDMPWYYYCSNCHRVISVASADQMEKFHAFCGTCGADMREEIEDA